MTGLHRTNNKGSIPGFQLPFFQNLPSKVAPTSVHNFCNHFILKAFLMSAKVTLNSQFAQGIATNLASDGAPTKQIVLPPGNGHLMAIQFQGREESLFVIPNYFTSKPKYCFLLAHVSLLPIIIYPTKLMCFTQEGVQQTLQSHICYYFAFLQKYASSVEGSWKKRHRSSYFPPQSPLQRQSKTLMTLRPKRKPQNISHKYVIYLINVAQTVFCQKIYPSGLYKLFTD